MLPPLLLLLSGFFLCVGYKYKSRTTRYNPNGSCLLAARLLAAVDEKGTEKKISCMSTGNGAKEKKGSFWFYFTLTAWWGPLWKEKGPFVLFVWLVVGNGNDPTR